ncbi:MAG: SsrA-binding protein [Patescibacteria group bacterium]|jgi:SsrA-binding protein|nr:SsrA-binding protein [Patescibacteria group bacterium]
MKTTQNNRKASFNYEILDKYTGGISLFGFEVKSIKEGKGSINEAYIKVKGDEVFLVGAHIPPYQPKNTPEDYNPYRERKILLNKKEVLELKKRVQEANLTIVPISLYNKSRYIKIDIALARGKKTVDKRQSIKKRDIEREIGRRLKN